MGFGQWYVRRGRIDRRTWWLHYVLPIGLLTLLASLADASFGHTLPAAAATAATWSPGPLASVVGLLTLVPSVTSNACRLHDRGSSAWWLLLGLLPLIGPVGMVGPLALFVVLGFLRGDAGPNRYGPPTGWTEPAAPEADRPYPYGPYGPY